MVLPAAPEPTIEQLRKQIIALQRISSLGVLAGGVFHELNNALTPILNYAKLGLRNPDPAYRERALKQIIESAERATTISRGMLGLARLGTGQIEREPADLSELVEEVVLLVNKDLAKHRVRLEVKISGNPKARVEPAQIQQVLINLLINARQAMPQGGVVRLRVATAANRPPRRDQRVRQWRWNRTSRSEANFRALLLNQEAPRFSRTRRHRPGPGRLPRHRRSPPRPHPRREPPGPGLDVHDHSAGVHGSPGCEHHARRSSLTLHAWEAVPRRWRSADRGITQKIRDCPHRLPAHTDRHPDRGKAPGSQRSMAGIPSVAVLRDIQTLFDAGTAAGLTDRQLLERFANRRDASSDAAFEVLVLRHGPMVLRVCRNMLRDEADAADAFQATFLVLVRRRGTIRKLESVGGWLYGVACRVAARARVDAARRRKAEERAALRVVEAVDPVEDIFDDQRLRPGRSRGSAALA